MKKRRLNRMVAIVTGASMGIGKEIALALGEEGASVVVNYSTHSECAEQVAHEIMGGGSEALVVRADVSQKKEVERMVACITERFGRLDILVNNAGIYTSAPSEELSEEDWDRVMDLDVKGLFFCCQAAAKLMISQGKGDIINIASTSGLSGVPMRAAYCAAKAAVVALTKVLAVEWAKYNIRVNTIAPGFIETEGIKRRAESGALNIEKLIERAPMKRFGTPREVANLAVFLLSRDSEYITGETVVIDGGWLAYGWI